MNQLVPPIFEIELDIPIMPVIPALIIPVDKYDLKGDSSIRFIKITESNTSA